MTPNPVVVYVEGGGGERKADLARDCKTAFGSLLKRATGQNFKVIACGSRYQAYRDFGNALEEGQNAVLLVDAEDNVQPGRDVWTHLRLRPGDGWEALDGKAFLMAVCMETWLVADGDALANHFGAGFKPDKIAKWPSLEAVPKSTLYDALKSATVGSKRGAYAKGAHSFKVLALINPEKLGGCRHAVELFDYLKQA